MSYLSILIASLLGSPHCALMCGGFAAISTQNNKPRLSQAYYHMGRLFTYSCLGIIAGLLGSSVNKLASQYGVTAFAALLAGATLIATSILSLTGKNFSLTAILPLRVFNYLHLKLARLQTKSPIVMFGLGSFTTLLPCGWLYTYLTIAAATGAAYQAWMVMCFFWLGTLPMLLGIGEVSKLLGQSIKKRVPLIVAILILIAGFFTLNLHFNAHKEHQQNSFICTS